MNISKRILCMAGILSSVAFGMDAPEKTTLELELEKTQTRLAAIVKQLKLEKQKKQLEAYLKTLNAELEEGNKQLGLSPVIQTVLPKESNSLDDLASIAHEAISQQEDISLPEASLATPETSQQRPKRKRASTQKATRSVKARPTDNPHACPVPDCTGVYHGNGAFQSLKMHLKKKHILNNICLICKEKVEHANATIHMQAHINKCQFCSRILATSAAHIQHVELVHPTDITESPIDTETFDDYIV